MVDTKEFTPMRGDTGCIVGLENVQNVIARRYPKTTRLRFQGVWNFFKDHEDGGHPELVAQAWVKEDDTWWAVVKPVEGTSQ